MRQLRLQQPASNLRSIQLQLVQARAHRQPAANAVVTVGIALVIIIALQLLITIGTSAGVYEISALKKEKGTLVESAQILSAQVNSLSSPQNLSNAAASLGMVANANPVFLSIKKQSISGKPAAAIAGYGSRISANLVPNSELVSQTSAGDLATLANDPAPVTANPVNADVATASNAAGQVVSSVSRIPASPTH